MMRCSAKTNQNRVCKNKVSRMRGEVYCPTHRASHETQEQAQKRELMSGTGGYGRSGIMDAVWKAFGEEAAAADALVNIAMCEDEEFHFYPDVVFQATLSYTAVPKNETERELYGVTHATVAPDHVLYWDNLARIRLEFVQAWKRNRMDAPPSILAASRFSSEHGKPVTLELTNHRIGENFRFSPVGWEEEDDDYRVHYRVSFVRV